MPWNNRTYPVPMKFLRPLVREKAIEIANALVVYGNIDTTAAVSIAIRKAREWEKENAA